MKQRHFSLLHFFFPVALLYLTISGSVESCEIDTGGRIPESSFVFTEVPEDYPVGEKLPKSLSILTGELESAVLKLHQETCVRQYSGQDYILAKCNNETNKIDFYLQQSLQNYHLRRWKPYIEFEFDLICSKDDIPYTYMITIEDANLHQPKFSHETYSGTLQYTTTHGFKINLKSEDATENGICIKDPDFNLKHANISISCEGESCSLITFHPKHKGFNEGHNFYVDVFLNELELGKLHLENGSTLQFIITANDSKYVSKSVNVNLLVAVKTGLIAGMNPRSMSTFFSVTLKDFAFFGIGCFVTMSCVAVFLTIKYLQQTETDYFFGGYWTWIRSYQTRKHKFCNAEIVTSPYTNRAFEVSRDNLRIDEMSPLREDAFGLICKGFAVNNEGVKITVAVKTVKRSADVSYFRALLSELKIMVHIAIEKHPNIVRLDGVCTENIRKSLHGRLLAILEEVYLVTQYCANGNLRKYLEQYRNNSSKTVSTLVLLEWSIGIAKGLEHLQKFGVVHGNLAAHNILLDHELVAKIGDFGFSGRLPDYSYNNHNLKASEALLWKWRAPECLRDPKTFSKMSDNWSFGIVLYEIFSLGQTPYSGVNWDENVVDRLEHGLKPCSSRPDFATNSLYKIMCDCWNLDRHVRPSITYIIRELESMKNEALLVHKAQKKDSLKLNEESDGYQSAGDRDLSTSMSTDFLKMYQSY